MEYAGEEREVTVGQLDAVCALVVWSWDVSFMAVWFRRYVAASQERKTDRQTDRQKDRQTANREQER